MKQKKPALRKCTYCGHTKFFVDTLGIEHCSKCFAWSGVLTEATGRLSYRQIELEEEIMKQGGQIGG